MITKQFEVEIGWGKISGQLFSNSESTSVSYPIIALHGFLDNSNSMYIYFKKIFEFIRNQVLLFSLINLI
jgi:hypothetical protein